MHLVSSFVSCRVLPVSLCLLLRPSTDNVLIDAESVLLLPCIALPCSCLAGRSFLLLLLALISALYSTTLSTSYSTTLLYPFSSSTLTSLSSLIHPTGTPGSNSNQHPNKKQEATTRSNPKQQPTSRSTHCLHSSTTATPLPRPPVVSHSVYSLELLAKTKDLIRISIL